MNASSHDFGIVEDEIVEGNEAATDVVTSWLDKYSVPAKIRGAVFGVVFALTALSATILGISHYISLDGDVTDQIRRTEALMGQSAMTLAEARERLPAEESAGFSEASKQAKEVSATMAFLLERGQKLPENIRADLDEFRVRSASLGDDISALGAEKSSTQRQTRIRSEMTTVLSDMHAFSVELHDYAEYRTTRMFDMITTALAFLLALLVIVPTIAFIFARKVVHNVAGKIVEITNCMERISRGEVNSQIPGQNRADEIGAMARALAIFRGSARRELLQMHELEEERIRIHQEKDKALDELAARFEETIGEVASSIGAASAQLQATASAMASNAELSEEQTAESAAAMNDSSSGVAAAASASDEFALSISEVSSQAAVSAELARNASQVTSEANDAINQLSSDAHEIGEIVELIQSIAQRTNLLALNASIEAARSGEAGRGFAVVASEVKELAARTAHATDQVVQKIGAIQSSTGTSVSALASVLKSISELEHTSVSIASAVDQQSIASQDLARNIDAAASSSDKVSHRLGKLNDVASETRSAASEVLTSSRQLEEQARALKEKASQFLSNVRGSAETTNGIQTRKVA